MIYSFETPYLGNISTPEEDGNSKLSTPNLQQLEFKKFKNCYQKRKITFHRKQTCLMRISWN